MKNKKDYKNFKDWKEYEKNKFILIMGGLTGFLAIYVLKNYKLMKGFMETMFWILIGITIIVEVAAWVAVFYNYKRKEENLRWGYIEYVEEFKKNKEWKYQQSKEYKSRQKQKEKESEQKKFEEYDYK